MTRLAILRKALLRPALAAGVALAATACASPQEEISRNLKLPSEQFPFVVGQAPDEILLAVHAEGLSPTQAAALDALIVRWRDAGGGPIVLRAPAGGPAEPAALAMAEQARLLLVGAGAPASHVRLDRYDWAADPAAPLVVGFSAYHATIPDCGGEWDNLTGTQSNTVYGSFGCSVSANMAAQVANPRDLVEARAADPVEASRRTYQMDLYRRGDLTGSKAPNEGGVVSQAVK